MHRQTNLAKDKKHSALVFPKLMNFLSFYPLLFSALYPLLSLTHMAAGCELMSRVENPWSGRQIERKLNRRKAREGGRERDEKTERVSQVFTMYCRWVAELLIEIATALEKSHRAYMGATENLWEKYGRQLRLTGCTSRRGWNVAEQGALNFGKMASEGLYLHKDILIDQQGGGFHLRFSGNKLFMLLSNYCKVDSLQTYSMSVLYIAILEILE